MRYEQPEQRSLFIINLILLCKTFCNKTRFVALNGPIRASLNLINPLETNHIFPRGGVTNLKYGV